MERRAEIVRRGFHLPLDFIILGLVMEGDSYQVPVEIAKSFRLLATRLEIGINMAFEEQQLLKGSKSMGKM
jgi:hypothetical protein